MCRRRLVHLSSRQFDARLRTKGAFHHWEVWGPAGLEARFGRGVDPEAEPVLRCGEPLSLRQPLRATIQLTLADPAGRCSSLTGSVHVKASVRREGSRGGMRTTQEREDHKVNGRPPAMTVSRHRQTQFKTHCNVDHWKLAFCQRLTCWSVASAPQPHFPL